MTPEEQLEYQSWVDGELAESQATRIKDQIDRDPEVRTFCQGLDTFRKALRDHEPTVDLPESRDFYWSKIRREIEESGSSPSPTRPPVVDVPFRWLGWLIPVGAAALALLWFFPRDLSPLPASAPRATMAAVMVGHEIEAPAEGMTALTFYSAQESMTVVWLGQVDLL